MNWCVVIYCGYSEWFDARDYRVVGPMSEEDARAYAGELAARQIPRRDGGTLAVGFMEMSVESAAEFVVA